MHVNYALFTHTWVVSLLLVSNLVNPLNLQTHPQIHGKFHLLQKYNYTYQPNLRWCTALLSPSPTPRLYIAIVMLFFSVLKITRVERWELNNWFPLLGRSLSLERSLTTSYQGDRSLLLSLTTIYIWNRFNTHLFLCLSRCFHQSCGLGIKQKISNSKMCQNMQPFPWMNSGRIVLAADWVE